MPSPGQSLIAANYAKKKAVSPRNNGGGAGNSGFMSNPKMLLMADKN